MDNILNHYFCRTALQQESDKYTHQRVLISNLKMSLSEALSQNTEYREKLSRIRGIVSAENEPRDVEDERDSETHTLPVIEVKFVYKTTKFMIIH